MVYNYAGKVFEREFPDHEGKIPTITKFGGRPDPLYRVNRVVTPDGKELHYIVPYYSIPQKQEGETALQLMHREVVYLHERATRRFFLDLREFCIGGEEAHRKYSSLKNADIDDALAEAEAKKAALQDGEKSKYATEVLYLQVLKLSHLTMDVIQDVYGEMPYMSRSLDVIKHRIKEKNRNAALPEIKWLYEAAGDVLDALKVVTIEAHRRWGWKSTESIDPDINNPQDPKTRALLKWIKYNIESHENYPEIERLYMDVLAKKDAEQIIRVPELSWMRKADLNTMLHEAITEIFKSLVPSFEFGFYRDRAAKVAQGQCDVDYIRDCLKEVLSAQIADVRGQEAIASFGGLIAKLPELAESAKLTLCVRSKDPIPGYFAHIRYEYFTDIAETKTSIDRVRIANNLDGNNVLALVELGINTIENTVSARKSHKQAMQDFYQLYNDVTQQLGLVTR